ncbi:MAG: hypothetical protein ACI4JN_08365 [Ruminococcus sp.]
MNNVKRIFAAMTAAASIGVFSFAAVSASAEEPAVTTEVTTETTPADGSTESTETTTTATDVSSDSSTTEETTTTAPSVKFNANLIVYAGEKEDKSDPVLVEKNGDYTLSYKFTSAEELTSLCLDTSFDASEYANVKITVKSVEFGDDEDKKEIKLKKNDAVFDTTTIEGHSLVVIMSKAAADDQQLGFEEGESITPEIDKSVYVTFSVEGLQEPGNSSSTSTTTVTTSRVYSYVGNNGNSKSTVVSTGTVAKTADTGVIAVIVTGAAAAAAAACAMTVRKKRK